MMRILIFLIVIIFGNVELAANLQLMKKYAFLPTMKRLAKNS
jgi:hypothetical protein